MAVLTASGILFNDSTSLNSRYDVIPQSSVAVFYQSSAPTGWTKVTTHNDKALRVVSGTGGGFGYGGVSGAGGVTFSSAFPSNLKNLSIPISITANIAGTVGNTTLSVSQIPDHTHDSLTGGTSSASSGGSSFRTPGNTATGGVVSPGGTGGSHNHPWSGSVGITSTATGSLDLRVQYIDVIICSFD
jgi:hypothetical protein